MALHDGFFDARYDEDTDTYDRAYGVDDFTTYFAHIVGSGVCIYRNPDSYKVRLEDGNAVVSPGYLFIDGHWQCNDSDYTVELTGDGIQAVVAHLNASAKRIDIEVRSVAQSYPDALVLALVDAVSGSAEDTRYNEDICGVIDAAGSVSSKIEWALNYIDKEIETKLAQAEAEIQSQSAKLDAKIAEVQAQIDKITPPPVGTIQFSASQNVGPEWLRCDGSFVNEKDYPELVAALGKLTPSGDKFQLLSSGEIGPQISNGALYGGRMWVYSYSTHKLYGADVEGGEPVKEVSLSSDSPYFRNFLTPSTAYPICLSIVPHKTGSGAALFLAQRLDADVTGTTSSTEYGWLSGLLLFQSEFTGEESSLEFTAPFAKISNISGSILPSIFLPYVVSMLENGEEKYLCAIGANNSTPYSAAYVKFGNSEATFGQKRLSSSLLINNTDHQRSSFSKNSGGECVFVHCDTSGTWGVYSMPNGTFDRGSIKDVSAELAATTSNALNVVGYQKMIAGFTLNEFPVIPITDVSTLKTVKHGISLPSSARVFVDGGAYLWGKDIYMIFVGTGIIFSRTLETGSFGYLDTTSVLGTITQFGYLDYSQDEGTLYLVGQDTTNSVKVAKIVLNTLYDYANDGAWLPVIASDGVPAYIKAYDSGGGNIPDPVDVKISVTLTSSFLARAELLFNGEVLQLSQEYTRQVSESGSFTVGARIKTKVTSGTGYYNKVSMNGTDILNVDATQDVGTVELKTFRSSDYLQSGITLKCTT